MSIYADSSFFMSAYVPDAHSPEALRRMARRPRIWLTPFHQAELTNAIAQQVFRSKMSAADADQTLHNIALNRDAWVGIDFPMAAFEGAIKLARTYVPHLGTRTLDVLHVACALEFKASQFWTFDERQAKLAKAAGLKVS